MDWKDKKILLKVLFLVKSVRVGISVCKCLAYCSFLITAVMSKLTHQNIADPGSELLQTRGCKLWPFSWKVDMPHQPKSTFYVPFINNRPYYMLEIRLLGQLREKCVWCCLNEVISVSVQTINNYNKLGLQMGSKNVSSSCRCCTLDALLPPSVTL